MRTIVKGVGPASLTQHRLSSNSDYVADYGNYQDMEALRISLVREQRGLCCYCLSRIRPESAAMKIEHWRSRKRYPAEQLDYPNLLGACRGNEGQSRDHETCDKRKGDKDLSRNPANQMHQIERLVRFVADGRIISDIQTFDNELNDVLNLNEAYLRNQRKKTLDAFTATLVKRGPLPPKFLRKWLQDWNGESHTNDLRPFCQVVVYWLRKRLDQA